MSPSVQERQVPGRALPSVPTGPTWPLCSQQETELPVSENHQAGVPAPHQPQPLLSQPLPVIRGEWVRLPHTQPQPFPPLPDSGLPADSGHHALR